MGRRLAASALLALAAGAAQAQGRADAVCDLHYRITPRHDTAPRVLDVELSFAAGERQESFIRAVPRWAGVEDFAAALIGWRGASEGTQVAAADLPHRWRVTHARGGTVRVVYQARAALADPDDGNRPQDQLHLYRTQIGRDWFQFFGHGVLPSVEHWGDDTKARLCVEVVQAAAQAASPVFGSHLYGRGPRVGFTLHASPHELRHAFYAGGPGWRVIERRLPSGPVFTAQRGRFAADDTTFADRTAALLDAHRRFWGDASAPPQWVVLTPNFARGNVGGTLVHRAAVLHAGADFGPEHDLFAFLVGHENLHQWIPTRFGRIESDDLKAREHYWFSEGFTNYYTHRLLLASGLWSLERYADGLTHALQGYWRSPARNAGAASLAPRFFSDRDAGQQMYSRGEVLAMRWDRALRERGHAGIDAVLKGLLLPADQPATPSTLLAHERVLDALAPLLGAMPRRDVQMYVQQGTDLPLDDGALAGPCFALDLRDVPRWALGFDFGSFDKGVAQGVIDGGPAHAAGLREGMKILAGSVTGGDLTRDVELTVQAPEGRRELRYRPVSGSERLPVLSVRAGAAGDAACRDWLRATPRS